jgi:hypothetical protein
MLQLKIFRPELRGPQGRGHFGLSPQGIVLIFLAGVILGSLAQSADNFPFFGAVMLAVGAAGLDVSTKQCLFFLFSEPTHDDILASL